MARLQILELPTKHDGDDMVTPFVLVIDQVDESAVESIANAGPTSAEQIGARAVFVFEETVEIPANATPIVAGDSEERAGTAEIVHAHERTRLALCDALLLSRDTTWRKLTERAAERQRTVADLYRQLDEMKATPCQTVGLARRGAGWPK